MLFQGFEASPPTRSAAVRAGDRALELARQWVLEDPQWNGRWRREGASEALGRLERSLEPGAELARLLAALEAGGAPESLLVEGLAPLIASGVKASTLHERPRPSRAWVSRQLRPLAEALERMDAAGFAGPERAALAAAAEGLERRLAAKPRPLEPGAKLAESTRLGAHLERALREAEAPSGEALRLVADALAAVFGEQLTPEQLRSRLRDYRRRR